MLTRADKKHYFQKTIDSTPGDQQKRSEYIGRRKVSKEYNIHHQHSSFRVCKDFFEAIHGISHSQITTFLNNRDENQIPVTAKGKVPSTTYAPEVLSHVRRHIDSFPRVESYYWQRDTKREFLESGLTAKKCQGFTSRTARSMGQAVYLSGSMFKSSTQSSTSASIRGKKTYVRSARNGE